MRTDHKAVVLGTDYYIGLSVVRNLGRHEIHVVTMDFEPTRYGISKYTQEAMIVPHFQKEEESFVQFLIDYANEQEEKPVLFLTSDPYVTFLDRHFDLLKEYYLFPMEEKGLLSKLMDKKSLIQLAKTHNILIPETIDLTEENLFQQVENKIGYPCLIKPRDSASFVKKFREKAFTVRHENQLKKRLQQLEGMEDQCFIQRIIPGPETNCYSYDAYYGPNSELMGYMTTQKIRQWPNNIGASTYVRQKWIPELRWIVGPLLKELNYRGFVEAEFKRDEFSDKVYLMEINVRFINFTELLCDQGLETPMMYYCDATDQKIPRKFISYNTNRHWKYKYEDIPAIYSYLKNEQMNLTQLFVDYKFHKVHSTWAWDDTGPGFAFFSWAIKRQLKKLTKKLDDY